MDVSVITPAYNCEKTIGLLLNALKSQETGLSYEVIVVDNESGDGTAGIVERMLRDYPVPLTLTRQPRGVTISAVRNHGAALSRGQVLAFIDSDCEPDPDWIERGDGLLRGAGGGALLAGGCRPPEDGTWVETSWHSIRAGHKGGSIFVHGANFFIHRSLFEKLGGFREELESSEDYDLGHRAALEGQVVPVPDFMVVHYGEANTLVKKIRKERWYSQGMFAMVAANPLYKPFWISVVFLVALIFLAAGAATASVTVILGAAAALLVLAIFLAGFFCRRADNFSRFVPLVPICFAYLLGRSLGIVDVLLGRGRAGKTTG